MKIAVCGKGGSGKSTIVALLANEACGRDNKVLVVDSDESNSGLYRMLGFDHPPVPLMELVGGKKSLKQKMSQPSILAESCISLEDLSPQHLAKRDSFILVSIGKILQSLEGCACPMGVLSREFLRKLTLKTDEMAIVQKAIYKFVKEKGKVTREEILEIFNMKETELQTHLAILRHCELIKGRKEATSFIWFFLTTVNKTLVGETTLCYG